MTNTNDKFFECSFCGEPIDNIVPYCEDCFDNLKDFCTDPDELTIFTLIRSKMNNSGLKPNITKI